MEVRSAHRFKLESPNPSLLLSSKGKGSTRWWQFLARALKREVCLRLFYAETEVTGETFALPEIQALGTVHSEGDHLLATSFSLNFRRWTWRKRAHVGVPDRRKSSKGDLLGPKNFTQAAVDFLLLANKHTSSALGSLAEPWSHTHICSSVLPRNAGPVKVLIMDYSLTSFRISCPYLLHFPSVSFFCSRPLSMVVYFFNLLTSTMQMKPFLPSSYELPCAAALSLTCAQMAGPSQQEPVMSILHGP